jgi:hypothetical protein
MQGVAALTKVLIWKALQIGLLESFLYIRYH